MRKIGLLFVVLLFTNSILATTYYVSSKGADSNAGNSEAKAWLSLNRVNTSQLLKLGDKVLFRKGDEFRGILVPKSGVYYGNYEDNGLSDALPLFLGSVKLNKTWVSEGNNIWKYEEEIEHVDVGSLYLKTKQETNTTITHNVVGQKRFTKEALNGQAEFYFHILHSETYMDQEADYFFYRGKGVLYMYSRINPSEVYSSIEAAVERPVIFIQDRDGVTIDGLAVKYGGSNGIGTWDSKNITVRNCVVSWTGGALLEEGWLPNTRYGNGIDFYGDAENILVENNVIYEIYDTALSNQYAESAAKTQKNIRYYNNVIWNCGMAAIEIWISNDVSTLKDIYFENNTCVNVGKGWSKFGPQRPNDKSDMSSCFAAWDTESAYSKTAAYQNVNIRNNIFANPAAYFYLFESERHFRTLNISNNCYYRSDALNLGIVRFQYGQLASYTDMPSFLSKSSDNTGAIYKNPMFADENNKDYRLQGASPCINAGINNGLSYDILGTYRPSSGIDMGAYQYQTITGSVAATKSDFEVYSGLNGELYIKGEPTSDNALITIHNLSGQELHRFRYSRAQNFSTGLSSGVYIVTLYDGDRKEREKVIIK